MKALRPGQVCMINGLPYRAKKRTFACEGCALDSPFACPNIQYSNQPSAKQIDCIENNIILIRD